MSHIPYQAGHLGLPSLVRHDTVGEVLAAQVFNRRVSNDDGMGEGEVVASLTVTGLSASRLVATDASKKLASVSDLSSWIGGTASQLTVTSDGDGSVTLSLPSAVTLPGTLAVTGHVTPVTDATYDIGSASFQWRDGRFSRDVYVGGTLRLGSDQSAPAYLYGATIRHSVSPAAGQDAHGLFVRPTITEAASGTHAIFAGAYFATPTINAGAGATVTDAATVFIQGAPSATGASNRSLYIFAGNNVIRDRLGVGPITTPNALTVLHLQNGSSNAQLYLERTGASAGAAIVGANVNGLVVSDSAGASKLTIRTADGGLIWSTDNVGDIGSAANRPRSIYWGTQALGPDGTASNPSYSFAGQTNLGFYRSGTDIIRVSVSGTDRFRFSTDNFDLLTNGGLLRFGSSNDVILTRDAANILAQRNGTTAQISRTYNTISGPDSEFFAIHWQANICFLRTDVTGTATARQLNVGTQGAAAVYLRTNGTNRWNVSSAGHWLAEADNTYDIGASGATRPRSLYWGTQAIGPTGSAAAPSYTFTGVTTSGFYNTTSFDIGVSVNSNQHTAFVNGLGIRLRAAYALTWSSAADITSTSDLVLLRDAANTLAQRNGTTAQTFRVYNSSTDAANYERATFSFADTASLLTIGTQAAGTGVLHGVRFVSGANFLFRISGSDRWQFNSSFHFLTVADNAYDIGASGATRPRTVYVGTSFVAPAGLVGTPSYTFSGDTDSGLFWSSDNTWGLVAGGTERVRMAGATMIWNSALLVGFSSSGVAGLDTTLTRGEAGCVRHINTRTITGAVTDGYTAAIRLSPTYDAATAQTVDRHNYIDLEDVLVTGVGPAAVTDAFVFRFNAALGTHKATTNVDKSGNAVLGTIKVNVNGTKGHLLVLAD